MIVGQFQDPIKARALNSELVTEKLVILDITPGASMIIILRLVYLIWLILNSNSTATVSIAPLRPEDHQKGVKNARNEATQPEKETKKMK